MNNCILIKEKEYEDLNKQIEDLKSTISSKEIELENLQKEFDKYKVFNGTIGELIKLELWLHVRSDDEYNWNSSLIYEAVPGVVNEGKIRLSVGFQDKILRILKQVEDKIVEKINTTYAEVRENKMHNKSYEALKEAIKEHNASWWPFKRKIGI